MSDVNDMSPLTPLTPEQRRVQDAQRALQLATLRAEYHGWNGASSRQYRAAKSELRAARKAARRASSSSSSPSPDERADAGRGAFIFGLLASLIVLASVATLALMHIGF